MNFTIEPSSHLPWSHLVFPTGWIAISGTGSCALSAVSDNFWESSQRISTSAASVPESMKRRSAPGVSDAWCPGGTRDKSKLISASSPSACSRCCFFTHGWFNHSAISRPTTRCPCRECGAQKLCTRSRSRIQCRHRDPCLNVVAELRSRRCRPPDDRASCLDSRDRRRISRWRRWFESLARIAHVAHHPVRIPRATHRGRSHRADAHHAIGALRHVYGAKFRSLVFVLRDEPYPWVPAHQNLGRRKPRPCGDEILPLHISWQRCHAAGIPGNLLREGHIRFCCAGRAWKKHAAHRQCGVARLCRNLSWTRGEGATVSISHLATRRL